MVALHHAVLKSARSSQTMKHTVRDSALGQVIRYLSGNKLLLYPEEVPGFQVPEDYRRFCNGEKIDGEKRSGQDTPNAPASDAHADHTRTNSPATAEKQRVKSSRSSDEETAPEHSTTLGQSTSHAIMPTTTNDGILLVDWYTVDDIESPQNWRLGKKIWVCAVLSLYTFVVYSGSAIYTTGEGGVSAAFDLSPAKASLPLSLYVLAYGVGPLLFSPLSEIAYFGRMWIYVITFIIFTALAAPTAVVNSLSGLLALRFFQGFFGSPCLATGGATMQDLFSLVHLPYALTIWVTAAFCGPALGPLISGFAVERLGWHWSLWPILFGAGITVVFMISLFPETAAHTILLRRAQRLRKLTGNPNIKSQSEIDSANISAKEVFTSAIIKPFEITLKDPAIAFVNIYTAIIYGTYYSFFESFPLVYSGIYGFSIGIIGVVFTCILISGILGIITYASYQYFYLIPDIENNGFRAQEHRLIPAMIFSFGPIIGLFIFAWTARSSISWVVPTIGIVIYGYSAFMISQCIFVYVPFSYPMYAASLFAANDFFRSALAAGAVEFARPLFINLGIANGVTLLGGLAFIGVIGVFVLYYHGAAMRARSTFATS